jgi:hypothetical protein
MARATIIASADCQGEFESAQRWFREWWEALAVATENYGCQCCLHIWDVEGPQEAVDDIPHTLRSCSAWADGDQVQPSARNMRPDYDSYPDINF